MRLLGNGVLRDDGRIDPGKMAGMIFADGDTDIRDRVNRIVHPAVKERILAMIQEASDEGRAEYFFIEAALLIEDNYDTIVDELWYIYAGEDVRRKRLRISRGYSDEKIDSIIRTQSTDETFRKYCRVCIDNSGTLEETKEQLKQLL